MVEDMEVAHWRERENSVEKLRQGKMSICFASPCKFLRVQLGPPQELEPHNWAIVRSREPGIGKMNMGKR